MAQRAEDALVHARARNVTDSCTLRVWASPRVSASYSRHLSHLSPEASLPSMLSAQPADEHLMRLEAPEVLDARSKR